MRNLGSNSPWVNAEVADDEVAIAMTRHEVAGFVNAMNEALNEVEDWEFQTRLGLTRAEARELLDQLSELYQAAPRRGLS